MEKLVGSLGMGLVGLEEGDEFVLKMFEFVVAGGSIPEVAIGLQSREVIIRFLLSHDDLLLVLLIGCFADCYEIHEGQAFITASLHPRTIKVILRLLTQFSLVDLQTYSKVQSLRSISMMLCSQPGLFA